MSKEAEANSKSSTLATFGNYFSLWTQTQYFRFGRAEVVIQLIVGALVFTIGLILLSGTNLIMQNLNRLRDIYQNFYSQDLYYSPKQTRFFPHLTELLQQYGPEDENAQALVYFLIHNYQLALSGALAICLVPLIITWNNRQDLNLAKRDYWTQSLLLLGASGRKLKLVSLLSKALCDLLSFLLGGAVFAATIPFYSHLGAFDHGPGPTPVVSWYQILIFAGLLLALEAWQHHFKETTTIVGANPGRNTPGSLMGASYAGGFIHARPENKLFKLRKRFTNPNQAPPRSKYHNTLITFRPALLVLAFLIILSLLLGAGAPNLQFITGILLLAFLIELFLVLLPSVLIKLLARAFAHSRRPTLIIAARRVARNASQYWRMALPSVFIVGLMLILLYALASYRLWNSPTYQPHFEFLFRQEQHYQPLFDYLNQMLIHDLKIGCLVVIAILTLTSCACTVICLRASYRHYYTEERTLLHLGTTAKAISASYRWQMLLPYLPILLGVVLMVFLFGWMLIELSASGTDIGKAFSAINRDLLTVGTTTTLVLVSHLICTGLTIRSLRNKL